MHVVAIILGGVLLAGVLLDAFETIILPRRPVGRFRITRLFFLMTWTPWCALVGRWPTRRGREQLYSFYGPMSLLLLFVVWAGMLEVAYALIYLGMGTPFDDPLLRGRTATELGRLWSCVYVSGTTLVTLGLGDVLPKSYAARMLVIVEAGNGLGFVALVIGYLPVLYTAFSSREVAVALLDVRAGSPPTSAELMARHSFEGGHEAMTLLLAEWERWCAEMLETHVSYPILCFYRSQHDNQSWISALTAVLDTCALLITAIDTTEDGAPCVRQAQLTFAMGTHTLVDLGHVFSLEEDERRLRSAAPLRLGDEEFARLCDLLRREGFSLCGDSGARERLQAIRRLYEPPACALSEYLRLGLPNWVATVGGARKRDGWLAVAELRSPTSAAESSRKRSNRHVSTQSTALHLEEENRGE